MIRFATRTQTENTSSSACGERIVGAERGLLQRQADARVAEHELDEDETADRGAELGGEAGQRRQDRVPARVHRHHAPVAETLGVGHRRRSPPRPC